MIFFIAGTYKSVCFVEDETDSGSLPHDREAYRIWAATFKAEPRMLTRRAIVAWKSIEVKLFFQMSDDQYCVSLAFLNGLRLIETGLRFRLLSPSNPSSPQTFLSNQFPEARAGLRPGATDDQIANFETCLDVKLPASLRVLYK